MKLSADEIERTCQAVSEANGHLPTAAEALGIKYWALAKRLQRIREGGRSGKRRRRNAAAPKPRPAPTPAPSTAPAAPVDAVTLVKDHLHIVDMVARNMHKTLPKEIAFDDLVQVGRIGLMEAAARFDPARGFKFSTYCMRRVRGAMSDYLRQTDTVSRRVRSREKVRKAAESEIRASGTEPTPEAVCEQLGWDGDDYHASVPHTSQSLQTKLFENDRGNLDLNAFQAASTIEHPLDRDERAREIFKGLSLEEQTLLYCYYWRSATMAAIGAALGLSESRISQLHKQVLARLRPRGREVLLDQAS